MNTLENETTVEVSEKIPETTVAQTEVKTNACTQFCKKPIVLASVLAILILVGAGTYVYNTQYKQGGIVAVVNGTKIYRNTFDENYALFEGSATQQGIDLSDEAQVSEMRTQVLNGLIDNALILSAANKSGITVSDEQIEEMYQELVTQIGSQEELLKRMEEVGLSEAKLRSNIKDRIIADSYIEQETDIENVTATEEEVKEFAQKLTDGGMELPPLEDIRPQIEAQILAEKKQQMVTELLDKMRSEANIDRKI